MEMIPVGNTGIQPDPLGSLSKMIALRSGMVGLQQQQQNLQTGQYAQASAQATAQQDQQKNAELQAAQNVAVKGAQSGQYTNPDGSLNRQKMADDISKVAPTYGQGISGQLLSQANEIVSNKQGLQALNRAQQEQLGAGFGSLATKPDLSHSDVIDFLNGQVERNPQLSRMAISLSGAMPPSGSTQDLQAFARRASIAATSPESAAAQSNPNVAMVQGQQGLVPTNVNPQNPGGVRPVGPAQQQGIAPTIVSPPGGVPTVVGAGQKGGPAAPTPGPQPTDQDWHNFGAYQSDLNSRVQLASDMLPRLKLTEAAADSIRTGAGTATRSSIAKSLQGLGAPQGLVDAVSGGNLADVQEAEKMMFQTTMSGLRQAMSNEPSRVAEFEAANKVFPTVDTDPRARATILGFMSDQGQRDYAEQQALNTSRSNGTFNPVTWQADYQKSLRANQVPGTPASQIPASAAQAGTTSKSKSGKPIILRNGRWEYQ